MKKWLLFAFIVMTAPVLAFADPILIKQFVIKENPFSKDELAIVATDTTGTPTEDVDGIFKFTINGFDENLSFEKGVAFYHHKLDKSSFIYLKHSNDKGSTSSLYYVYKQDDKLSPYHVAWIWLIAIPVILILLAYMFKRFIIIAAIIFCIFLYFNHHSGLGIATFFETILDGLKHLF